MQNVIEDAQFVEGGTRCPSLDELNVLSYIVQVMRFEGLSTTFVRKVVDEAVFNGDVFGLAHAWFIAGTSELGRTRKREILDELTFILFDRDDTVPYNCDTFARHH